MVAIVKEDKIIAYVTVSNRVAVADYIRDCYRNAKSNYHPLTRVEYSSLLGGVGVFVGNFIVACYYIKEIY